MGVVMARKRYSAEQIIVKLREAEVLEAKGKSLGEIARSLGTAEQTLIRWRKEYGGLRLEQAKRFKELEKENIRLKRLVADLSLDNAILKDTSLLRPLQTENLQTIPFGLEVLVSLIYNLSYLLPKRKWFCI